jgi:hypothetical protein
VYEVNFFLLGCIPFSLVSLSAQKKSLGYLWEPHFSINQSLDGVICRFFGLNVLDDGNSSFTFFDANQMSFVQNPFFC